MVDEEALSAHEHPVATVRQLEEVKGEIMFMLNHPASKALALKVEEAVLAVGDGLRETLMSKWHGRGTALTNDGRLAATGQPVRYGGGLITTSRPQWVNHNGSPAVGQTREAPCTLKTCQKTHGVASTTRLRLLRRGRGRRWKGHGATAHMHQEKGSSKVRRHSVNGGGRRSGERWTPLKARRSWLLLLPLLQLDACSRPPTTSSTTCENGWIRRRGE